MARFRYLLPAYVTLLIVIFLLPYYSAEGYSVIKNTTSQLGAQNSPKAWIMNTVFFLMGTVCILEGCLRLRNFWFQKAVLGIFGLALIMAAFFQHAPITDGPFNHLEDQLHSIAATLVGFSFTALAFSAVFVVRFVLSRILAFSAGCISVVLSILMFSLPDYTGILQRLMFILAFAWLIYFFEHFRTAEFNNKACHKDRPA